VVWRESYCLQIQNRLIIEPGTDNSIEVNGFIVINSNSAELAVLSFMGRVKGNTS
jgi:hypothetical protein